MDNDLDRNPESESECDGVTTTILAIDPGLSCGWCLTSNGKMLSGVWNLRGNRFEGAGMRMIRLRKYLREVLDSGRPGMVAFEEVRRHMGVDAAHLYGAIIHLVMEACDERQIPYQGVPVQAIKKFATQKGNAKKDAMIAAARGRWPEAQITDDNEADARWIAAYAESQFVAEATVRA